MGFYVFLSLYIAIQFLVLNAFLKKIVDAVFIVSLLYQVITATRIFLDYLLDKRGKEGNGANMEHVKDMIQLIITMSFWVIGALFVLSNVGINVTSLVAGLGVGGIAVALAVQNILGDLLSYFAIYFDRPFIKGDFIVVGDQTGIVEKVGIKTTRIRALQGEELVISNSELTSSRIQNFKKMAERRIVFSIGVVYETPVEKLENIPHMIRDIISSLDLARFDRAHLSAFGDSAYLYEIVYYVLTADYNQYMDVHQMMSFQIIKAFAQEGIEFAYPTQTIYLARG
jgi:small-conductance mechanosensitive channel